MARPRANLDDRLVTALENRMLMCERRDGEHRLLTYVATSSRGTFLAFANWPEGEPYTSCTFDTQQIKRDGEGWRCGPWHLRTVSYKDDDEILDGFKVYEYDKANSVNFDARMDDAERVLAEHPF